MVVATMAATETATVAAAPTATSVSEEKNDWSLNGISFLVCVTLLFCTGGTLTRRAAQVPSKRVSRKLEAYGMMLHGLGPR